MGAWGPAILSNDTASDVAGDYRELIENPRAAVIEIDNFLGGRLDIEAMVNAVDPELYRQRLQ